MLSSKMEPVECLFLFAYVPDDGAMADAGRTAVLRRTITRNLAVVDKLQYPFVQMHWRGWPSEHPHMCYHAELGRPRSIHVRITSRETAKLWSARAMLPWDGGPGWPPKNEPLPHMCYHAEFSHSSLKNVVIDRGESQKFGSTGAAPLWDGAMAGP